MTAILPPGILNSPKWEWHIPDAPVAAAVRGCVPAPELLGRERRGGTNIPVARARFLLFLEKTI